MSVKAWITDNGSTVVAKGLICFVVLVALCVMVSAQTTTIEAESAVLVPPMVVGADPSASGGAYVLSATNFVGSATFNFSVPAGDHIIWMRHISTSSGSDSLLIALDGAVDDIFDTAENAWSPNWQWTKVNGRGGSAPMTLNPRVFQLTAGAHSLVVTAREANVKIDKIIITTDLTLVPDAVPAPTPTPTPGPTPEPSPVASIPYAWDSLLWPTKKKDQDTLLTEIGRRGFSSCMIAEAEERMVVLRCARRESFLAIPPALQEEAREARLATATTPNLEPSQARIISSVLSSDRVKRMQQINDIETNEALKFIGCSDTTCYFERRP